MNVYIRQVATALAHRGASCTVYVRKSDPELPKVELEPGVTIVHIEAGDYHLPKEDLARIADLFATEVMKDLTYRKSVDVIHANYWLSGLAGHKIKHELNIPLVTTFHTLGKTKIESGSVEPNQRLVSEQEIIGCSEIVVANSENEQQQLRNLYDAPSERIKIVPLGVEQALFSPGNQNAAREALHLPTGPICFSLADCNSLKELILPSLHYKN